MQRSDANQSRRLDEAWFFLAEYSLSELLPDHNLSSEHTGKSLFPGVREVETPPECMENIDRALVGFAKEALEHFRQGRMGLPGRIRVFCQRKLIDDASTARHYISGQAIEDPCRIFDIHPEMNGGWGCFMIEKGGEIPVGSSEDAWSSVDLYLYQEGDASSAFGGNPIP